MTKNDEAVKKINSIRVIARWNNFHPDCRQWKPSTPEIGFDEPLKIAVDVPLQKELIDNADIISMAQLSNQAEPSPIFTPLGMRYIIDQFEAVMGNGEAKEAETSEDDEDWEDETTEPKPEPGTRPIEWDDEEETKETEDDKQWDEEWEE
jgi:hypothetical protein